jgi:hypothetical protein
MVALAYAAMQQSFILGLRVISYTIEMLRTCTTFLICLLMILQTVSLSWAQDWSVAAKIAAIEKIAVPEQRDCHAHESRRAGDTANVSEATRSALDKQSSQAARSALDKQTSQTVPSALDQHDCCDDDLCDCTQACDLARPATQLMAAAQSAALLPKAQAVQPQSLFQAHIARWYHTPPTPPPNSITA